MIFVASKQKTLWTFAERVSKYIINYDFKSANLNKYISLLSIFLQGWVICQTSVLHHFNRFCQRGAERWKIMYVYLVPQLIIKDVSKNLLKVKAIIIQAVDDNECDKKSRC